MNVSILRPFYKRRQGQQCLPQKSGGEVISSPKIKQILKIARKPLNFIKCPTATPVDTVSKCVLKYGVDMRMNGEIEVK